VQSVFDGAAGQDIYEPERVVAERLAKGVTQYHVKWAGFDSKHNTWETLQHLAGCEDLIADMKALKKQTDAELEAAAQAKKAEQEAATAAAAAKQAAEQAAARTAQQMGDAAQAAGNAAQQTTAKPGARRRARDARRPSGRRSPRRAACRGRPAAPCSGRRGKYAATASRLRAARLGCGTTHSTD